MVFLSQSIVASAVFAISTSSAGSWAGAGAVGLAAGWFLVACPAASKDAPRVAMRTIVCRMMNWRIPYTGYRSALKAVPAVASRIRRLYIWEPTHAGEFPNAQSGTNSRCDHLRLPDVATSSSCAACFARTRESCRFVDGRRDQHTLRRQNF